MFGANAFGWLYFGQAYAGTTGAAAIVISETDLMMIPDSTRYLSIPDDGLYVIVPDVARYRDIPEA